MGEGGQVPTVTDVRREARGTEKPSIPMGPVSAASTPSKCPSYFLYLVRLPLQKCLSKGNHKRWSSGGRWLESGSQSLVKGPLDPGCRFPGFSPKLISSLQLVIHLDPREPSFNQVSLPHWGEKGLRTREKSL